MATLLFIYMVMAFCCYSIGKITSTKILKCTFKNELFYIPIGIIAIISLARIWSLFFNVAGLFLIFIFVLTLFSFLIVKGLTVRLFLHRTDWLLFCIPAIFILFFCSQQSITYDEGLYHAAFIAWLNKFGIVKGLANLHGRLAFDSSWHVFASVFNFSNVFSHANNQINGFFALWGILFFTNESKIYLNKIKSFSNIALLFILFPTLSVYHLIDPSADFIVEVWGLIILYLLYFYQEKEETREIAVFIFISTVFLLTVKLSSGVLLLANIFVFRQIKEQQFKVVLFASIFVGLWIISNYILSGYLIYPYLKLHGLEPKWLVPNDAARIDILGIQAGPYQRWTNIDFSEFDKYSVIKRIIIWFKGIRLFEKMIYLTALISYLFLFLKIFTSQKKKQLYQLVALVLGLVGLSLTIVSAPDFRFAAGYIFFAWTLVLCYIKFQTSGSFKLYFRTIILAEMICILILYIHLKGKVNNPSANWERGLAMNYLFTQKYPISKCDTMKFGTENLYVFQESDRQFNWDKIPGTYLSLKEIMPLYGSPKIGFFIRNAREQYRYATVEVRK